MLPFLSDMPEISLATLPSEVLQRRLIFIGDM